jgi:hypothetical protein
VIDLDTARRILAALDREQVRYVLVGGVAINFHGLARATKDIDLFLDVAPDNVERLKRALRSVFDDPALDEISAEDLAGAYPTIRYGPPTGELVIDLIGRLGEAFRYEDLEAVEVEVAGVRVRLATPRTLYRMKRDTLRLQDRADAEMLRRKFHLEED